MRHYVADEISKKDMEKIRNFLNEKTHPSSIEGLYWVHLTEDLLDDIQYDHKGCWPYCFAVELGTNSVKFEFLIRSRSSFKCTCLRYANPIQRDFIINFAEGMIENLNIKT